MGGIANIILSKIKNSRSPVILKTEEKNLDRDAVAIQAVFSRSVSSDEGENQNNFLL